MFQLPDKIIEKTEFPQPKHTAVKLHVVMYPNLLTSHLQQTTFTKEKKKTNAT